MIDEFIKLMNSRTDLFVSHKTDNEIIWTPRFNDNLEIFTSDHLVYARNIQAYSPKLLSTINSKEDAELAVKKIILGVYKLGFYSQNMFNYYISATSLGIFVRFYEKTKFYNIIDDKLPLDFNKIFKRLDIIANNHKIKKIRFYYTSFSQIKYLIMNAQLEVSLKDEFVNVRSF